MKTAVLLIVLVLGGLAYIRFAPGNTARWHVDPTTASDPAPGGVLRRVSLALPPAQALQAFDAIVGAEPRTSRLAGTPDEGRITYVARSKVIGFPDYITVAAMLNESEANKTGSTLCILSRLRFGKSDMGVNAARLDRWLQVLEAAQN